MDVIDCNTCGNTGRWETTLEDAPTTLVDLGPCPDCDLGVANWCVVQADGGVIDRYYSQAEAEADLTPDAIVSGHRVEWVQDPGTL